MSIEKREQSQESPKEDHSTVNAKSRVAAIQHNKEGPEPVPILEQSMTKIEEKSIQRSNIVAGRIKRQIINEQATQPFNVNTKAVTLHNQEGPGPKLPPPHQKVKSRQELQQQMVVKTKEYRRKIRERFERQAQKTQGKEHSQVFERIQEVSKGEKLEKKEEGEVVDKKEEHEEHEKLLDC